MEIVTGSTGVAHVTPIDDAIRNSNYGYYTERVVFDVFRAFEAVAVTANEVRVYGGYGMNQGRIFKIDQADYDSVTIENGSQGVKRADLIVARYLRDSQTGFESIELAVIKGQSGQSYVDPEYVTGAINEGDSQDDFPLYRVKINGIVIEDTEPLFEALPEGGRIGAIEQTLNTHLTDHTAPHTITWTESSNLVAMAAADTMAAIFGKVAKAISSLIAHIANKTNPHEVKGSQLVVGNANEAVPISKGGTGATTAEQALANLGVPSDVANAATKAYVNTAVGAISTYVNTLSEKTLPSRQPDCSYTIRNVNTPTFLSDYIKELHVDSDKITPFSKFIIRGQYIYIFSHNYFQTSDHTFSFVCPYYFNASSNGGLYKVAEAVFFINPETEGEYLEGELDSMQGLMRKSIIDLTMLNNDLFITNEDEDFAAEENMILEFYY